MKRKIFLVDDDAHILDSIERVLYCDDYEITKFTNPVEALEIISKLDGEIDLVISDNKMPQIKGIDFLISIRKKHPDIIRIMLTGESDLQDAQSAINDGKVYRFLIKPVDPYELELIVKRALAHKDLWLNNKKLLDKIKAQEQTIASLEKNYPGISKVEKEDDGAITISDEDLKTSFDEYMKNINAEK